MLSFCSLNILFSVWIFKVTPINHSLVLKLASFANPCRSSKKAGFPREEVESPLESIWLLPLCARIFGTPCKVYIEAIELSSCWLYWVLLAEWMMLKAFSPKWEERNAKKNSFASFLCLLFCCFLPYRKKGLSG